MGCGLNSHCDTATGQCVCNFGFGIPDDGNTANCTKSESVFLNAFEPIRGNGDWAVITDETAPSELGHAGERTSDPSIIRWVVAPGYTANASSVGAHIRAGPNATEWGLCTGHSADDLACFVYSASSREIIASVFHDGKETTRKLGMPYEWPTPNDPEDDSPFVSFSIAMKGHYVTVSIDGKQVGKAIYMPFLKPNGGAALRASSVVAFSNLFLATSRNLIMNLIGCLTPQEFATSVAAVLGIEPSQVTNVKMEGGKCHSPGDDRGLSVAFSLIGDGIDTADSLASDLRSKVANKDISLAHNGLHPQNLADDLDDAAPSEVVEFFPTRARISAGAVVGVALGCIAAAAVAVALAVKHRPSRGAPTVIAMSPIETEELDTAASHEKPHKDAH
jgi:hypothetical protein